MAHVYHNSINLFTRFFLLLFFFSLIMLEKMFFLFVYVGKMSKNIFGWMKKLDYIIDYVIAFFFFSFSFPESKSKLNPSNQVLK